jgi:hypothetical protein
MSLEDSYNAAKADLTLSSIDKLLKANGLTTDDVGKISKVSLSNNPDDTKIILSPKWNEGPAWQPVQPADPVIINPKPTPTPALISSGWKVAVALPDPQIGYRKYEDGTLDPFHDEDAMDVALQIVGLDHGHPVDQVINLGDFLDLPMYGTYEQEANFAHTAQLAINRGHKFLAEQRANAGADARIILLEGNHDKRLTRFINNNASAAYGIKVANMMNLGWSLLMVTLLQHTGLTSAFVLCMVIVLMLLVLQLLNMRIQIRTFPLYLGIRIGWNNSPRQYLIVIKPLRVSLFHLDVYAGWTELYPQLKVVWTSKAKHFNILRTGNRA